MKDKASAGAEDILHSLLCSCVHLLPPATQTTPTPSEGVRVGTLREEKCHMIEALRNTLSFTGLAVWWFINTLRRSLL